MDKAFTHQKNNMPANNSKSETNNTFYTPSNIVINNILNYSKSLDVKKSKLINKIEMILN